MKRYFLFFPGLFSLLFVLTVRPSYAEQCPEKNCKVDGSLNVRTKGDNRRMGKPQARKNYTPNILFAGMASGLVLLMSSTGGAMAPAGFPQSGTGGWLFGVLLFGLTAPIPIVALFSRRPQFREQLYQNAWKCLWWF